MTNFEMTGKTTSDFEQPQTGIWCQLFVSML